MKPENTKSPQLVASYWTLAGAYPGRGPAFSRFAFVDRVAAASEAGFCGLGLLDTDLEQIQRTHSFRDVKKVLDDHGLTHVELEFLVDWFVDGEPRRLADQHKRFLFDAAEILKPSLIKVGDFSQSVCPMPRLIDSFAQLCAEAAVHGTRIAFEPMGASLVHNLKDALTLVGGAAAPNGGLAVDIWHMVNLKIPFDQLSKIPLEFLFCVELNDALLDPTSDSNPRVDRRFCGEGDLDNPAFVEAIRKTGFDSPWGVEIFSDELAALPLQEAAVRSFRSTMGEF